MTPDPNEDFCRKLCEKHGLAQVCDCEDCRHARGEKSAMALVHEAIQIVMEKAVEVIEDVYGPEAKVNDPREFIIERLRSLQLSAEDVADSLRKG